MEILSAWGNYRGMVTNMSVVSKTETLTDMVWSQTLSLEGMLAIGKLVLSMGKALKCPIMESVTLDIGSMEHITAKAN